MIASQDATPEPIPTPKELLGNEMIDGKTVCCKLCAGTLWISLEILTPDTLMIQISILTVCYGLKSINIPLQINVYEGLMFSEGLFDSSEIMRLSSVANDLRTAGRKGEYPGKLHYFLFSCSRSNLFPISLTLKSNS